MSRSLFRFSLVVAVVASALVSSTDVVTLKSGNGTTGGKDSVITVKGIGGKADGFAETPASISSMPISVWQTSGINALWVSPTSSSYSTPGYYQYIVPFNIDGLANKLDLLWRSDDYSHVSINGIDILPLGEVTGTANFADPIPGHFQGDVGTVTHTGVNYLTFEVANADIGSNPSGLQFEARLSVSTVPEPLTLLLMLGSAAGYVTKTARSRTPQR